VNLIGKGLPSYEITVIPSSVDFGDVPVGSTSKPRAVRVENTGFRPQTIQLLQAVLPTAFSTVGLPWGTCDHFGTYLEPGQWCNLAFTFSPSAPMEYTGSATVESTDSDLNAEIELLGRGVTAKRSVEQQALLLKRGLL
jgi:hypothetical protein